MTHAERHVPQWPGPRCHLAAITSPMMGPETGYRSVIFDCDSTLCGIEGIDELAGTRRDEVRAMTELAMDGSVPLEEVYGRRLELIAPTRAQVHALGAEYVRRLADDAGDTVRELLRLGVTVRIVSGGLMPAVLAVALELESAGSDRLPRKVVRDERPL